MGWARTRSLLAHKARDLVEESDHSRSEAIQAISDEYDIVAREIDWAYEQLFE